MYGEKSFLIIPFVVLGAILWSQREIFVTTIEVDNRLLLVYTICMTIAFVKLIRFLFLEKIESISDTAIKGYLSIVLVTPQSIMSTTYYTPRIAAGADMFFYVRISL